MKEIVARVRQRWVISRVVGRWRQRLADQAPGQRGRARELTQPINRPKSIPRKIQKENGETMAGGEETVKPDRKDIQPKDVFTPSTNNMGVYNLAETGKDFEEDRVEKNRGYETVNNLSQYLIRTDGGGEGGPKGKQL